MPIPPHPREAPSPGPEARAALQEALTAANETAAAAEAMLPPMSSRARGPAVPLVGLAAVCGAILLLATGMVLGGIFRPAGPGLPASLGPVSATGGTALAAAGTPGALAAESTTASAAAAAVDASNRAQAVLVSASAAATQALALAAPALARQPSAQDPSGTLAPLEQAQTTLEADARTAQRAASTAAAGAAAAKGIAQSDPAASAAAERAASLASEAAAASARSQEAASQDGLLVQRVQGAIQAWQAVHAAPPGYLGVRWANPTAGFGVGGCEIVAALAGTPAAQAGLVGSSQRTDPVGDTIQRLVDQTDANASWPIASCQDLAGAMAQTRAGDRVAVYYQHRQVIWYLLSGRWEPRSAEVTLTSGTCPPPVTGQVVDTRIRVTLQLTGPAGTATVPAIVDTGGARGWMDAGLLDRLGFKPEPRSRFDASGYLGAPPGTSGYLYRIPFPAILDAGSFVPLGQGSVQIEGIVGLSSWSGSSGLGSAGLGPVELAQVRFQNLGQSWRITWPSCGS